MTAHDTRKENLAFFVSKVSDMYRKHLPKNSASFMPAEYTAADVHDATPCTQELASLSHTVGIEQKQCYSNIAALMLLENSENMRYVIGYADACGVPVEHCWLAIEGQHFDPTWELLLGEDREPSIYLPMFTLTLDEVDEHTHDYYPDLTYMVNACAQAV